MRALMAPPAGREVIAPEGAITVMAAHTALRARRIGVVLQWSGCRDLPGLRDSRSDAMAVRATEALALSMLRMTETDFVSFGIFRNANIPADLVAHVA